MQTRINAIVIAFLIGIPAGIVSAVQERHGLGLRRQSVRAVGHFDAQISGSASC